MSVHPGAVSARSAVSLLAFIALVAAATAGYVFQKGIPPAQVACAYGAFIILLVPYLGFGFTEVSAGFRQVALKGPAGIVLLMAILAVPGALALIWGRGAAGILPSAGLLVYASAPALLLSWAARRGPPPNFLDALAVLAAWIPVEVGLLSGLWAAGGADPSYVLGKSLSVSTLLVGYVAIRPLEGLGYRWRMRLEDLGVFAVAVSAFLVLAVPAAILSGFVEYHPRGVSLVGLLYRILAIGLLIALPEEILFRGVILNLLEQWMVGRHGPWPALLVSSVIFGLSHMNNFPIMDFRYVAIATYAGVWYGWCYLRTGNLMAGILTHTAVDVIHRLLLVTT